MRQCTEDNVDPDLLHGTSGANGSVHVRAHRVYSNLVMLLGPEAAVNA